MRAAPTLAVDLRAIAAAVHATGIQRQRGNCVNIWAFLWRIASGLCGETARNLRNNLFSRDEVEKAVNVIHVVNVIQQGSCNVSIGIHHCISNVSCSFFLRWMIGYPSYMAQILMDSAEARELKLPPMSVFDFSDALQVCFVFFRCVMSRFCDCTFRLIFESDMGLGYPELSN
jgi:hypothetical protein